MDDSGEDRDLLDPTVIKGPGHGERKKWPVTVVFVCTTLVVTVLLLGAGFAGGLLAGKAIYGSSSSASVNASCGNASCTLPNWGGNVTLSGGKTVPVTEWLDAELQPDNIKENLRELTEKPHIAGNVSDMEVAMLIYNRWKGYKTFDRVELANYTVLLQYPGNGSSPNRLELRESGGEVVYTAATRQEKPLLPQERDPSVAPPFNAYSGTGNVSGPLVYVNYGRLEDFYYLNTTLNISLDGHICIIRYGKIYRGDKVTLNERVQISPSKLSCH
jgi:hypothetical protein